MTEPTALVVAAVTDVGEITREQRWDLRPATVVVAGTDVALGRFDGEGFNGETAAVVPLTSLIGYLPVGAHVMVTSVPPQGNYVTADLTGPSWVSYTPEFTSTGVTPSVGDGSVTGRWLKIGRLTIAVEVSVAWGAGSNQGTGRYFWSTPFGVAVGSNQTATGACYMLDNGTANRAGIVNALSGLDQYFVTNTPNGDVGANVPHAWASTDRLTFSIIHEITAFS
jgi:hypothetical protein